MTRKYIRTELAPLPIGCYSQAVLVNETLYLAGQIPLNPLTGKLHGETFSEQLIQVCHNISGVLDAVNADFSKIVRLTVYLRNFEEDYRLVNDGLSQFFNDPYPARTTIGVAHLPLNALVEIEAIAVL